MSSICTHVMCVLHVGCEIVFCVDGNEYIHHTYIFYMTLHVIVHRLYIHVNDSYMLYT